MQLCDDLEELEALIKAGVRSLTDVTTITSSDVPTLPKEDLLRIQSDKRVLQHAHKQEL